MTTNILSDDVVEYQMQIHIFGNIPSPSEATFGLRKWQIGERKEAEVRQFVERNFYVDDGLLSLPAK